VLASGPCNVPVVPSLADAVPNHIEQLTPQQYRSPSQLAAGGVLVVGAAATGVQIAREISQSGRRVTLAVGEHVRLPRSYRGRDIQHWMQALGLLDEGYREVDDLTRVRGLPSPQLIGHPDRIDMDLNALAKQGVGVVGRCVGIQGRTARFSGGLTSVVKLADLKLERLLRSIDAWIECAGLTIPEEAPPAPTQLGSPPRLSIDLRAEGIDTIVWATGFRPDYSWLDVPVLDRRGRLRHEGGITPAPGLYAMGLPFMRRRKSGFLFGAGDDARDIVAHLAGFVHREYHGALVGVA
jgi:putative flavoprotein involved in K+ transport